MKRKLKNSKLKDKLLKEELDSRLKSRLIRLPESRLEKELKFKHKSKLEEHKNLPKRSKLLYRLNWRPKELKKKRLLDALAFKQSLLLKELRKSNF